MFVCVCSVIQVWQNFSNYNYKGSCDDDNDCVDDDDDDDEESYSRWETNQAYLPSKLEDVRWHHQFRTGRNQWDPSTPIYCPQKSGQKWSLWKSCSQKAVTPTWKRGQRTQLCGKHRNWGAEKWQQVLWTDGSKSEIFGWKSGGLVTEGLESRTIMSVCRQQWRVVEAPCKSDAAFQQIELGIWSGTLLFWKTFLVYNVFEPALNYQSINQSINQKGQEGSIYLSSLLKYKFYMYFILWLIQVNHVIILLNIANNSMNYSILLTCF